MLQTALLSSYFVKADSSEMTQVTLVEAGEMYHNVTHHHSYASQDCLSKLATQWYTDYSIAKKKSCGQTKATCIVENVLATKSVQLLLEDLDAAHFSIGCDAFNNGKRKFYPVTIHYFFLKEGIKEGLLYFYNDNKETNEVIAAQFCRVLVDSGLGIDRVSAYVADNAAVNLGKYKSVFQKLKHLNNRLIDMGCKCQVLQNWL